MSQSIDEKVVSLKFNNKQFEAGVDSTLKRVDKLNKGMKFDGVGKGLEKLADKTEKLDLSKMEVSIDRVHAKLSALSAVGFAFVDRMTNALIDFSKKTIDTFAIEPVTTGFNEYELKMSSVQTIMASTGASVQEVNHYLDELNKYSDKTIYSFSDMTENIGKFTNAGVGLKDAVNAIKGISNEAAISGANANEASRAMYNFAQALSSGSVKLIDWKSIELANMATVEFKNELLKTATEIGTVAKNASGMYEVLTTNASGSSMKEAIDATHNFNESLAYQWMTTDVLTKTLGKYADENEEIGKKAYAAAQDIKTFSMMLDTLKEAAQSGWAETWQLVVGDFEEAKDLWTGFSGFFEELIGSSAEARNSLVGNVMRLQNDEGLTGRLAMWESVKNLLEALVQTAGAVSDAFKDIFPPITDQRLRLMIENLLNFSRALKSDEERLEKMRRTFRGIFAVLDMFVTTVRFAFRVGKTVITEFVDVVSTLLVFSITKIMDWANGIDTATSGFSGWLRTIRDGFRDFLAYVDQLEGGLTIESLFKALGSFGENVISKIFSFDMFREGWENFLADLQSVFTRAGDNTTKSTGKITQIISNMLSFLVKAKDKVLDVLVSVTGSITPEQVLAAGIGLALLLLVKTFSGFTKSLTELSDNISGVFDRINKTMKSFSLKLKTDAMWNFAKSIALLVGSLALLTGLDQEKMGSALIAMGLIAAGVTAMTIAMSKFSGSDKHTLAFTTMLIGLTVAIKEMAKTVDILSSIDFEGGLTRPMALLGALAAGLVAIGKALSSKTKTYATGALSMVGFVVALKMLVGTLEDLTQRNLVGTKKGLENLLGLSAVLVLVGKSLSGVSLSGPLTIVALVGALKLVLASMETISGYDDSTINRSVKTITKIFAAFGLMTTAMGLLNMKVTSVTELSEDGKKKTTKSTDNLKQIGSAIIKMAASLIVVAGAMKIFGNFDADELSKAEGVILKLLVVFGGIVAVSKFSGENASKAGDLISKMTKATLAISALVALLSLFDDPNVLKAPLRLIEELLLVMGAVVALSGLAGRDGDVGKTVSSMTTAVVALSGVVALLTLIDPNALQNSTKALTQILLAFGAVVAATGVAKKANSTLLLITGVIAVLGGVLYGMSTMETKDALASSKALSLLMASLSASLLIISTAKGFDKGVMGKMAILVGLTAALGAVLGWLESQEKPMRTGIETAASLSLLMVSLAAAVRLISNVGEVSNRAMVAISLLTALTGGLAALLGWFESMKEPLTISIESAASLSLLMITLASATKIIAGIEEVSAGAVAAAAGMGLVLGEIALVVGIIENWGDNGLAVSIQNAASLSLLLASVAGSIKILEDVKDVKTTALLAAAGMGLVVGELQLVVGGLEKLGITTGIDNALSLSILVIAISKATQLISQGKTDFLSGISGVGVMVVLIAAMGLLMTGIGALVREHPTIQADIDTAVTVLESIGTGIGKAIGGIIGGIIGTTSKTVMEGWGQGLSAFGEAIQPFFDAMNQIPEGSIDKAIGVGQALVEITKGQLIDAVQRIFSLRDSLQGFVRAMPWLAEGLASFAEETEDLVYNENSKNAIALLGDLSEATKNIPNSGGLLGAIVGDNDAKDWGPQLEALGEGLTAFTDGVKNIAVGKHTDDAIVLIKKLADATAEIPNQGISLLSLLIGDNKPQDWADGMKPLAQGLVVFAYSVKEISTGKHTEDAIVLMKDLAKAASDIPNTGASLVSLIVGDNDMGKWADGMKPLGEGLATFSKETKSVTDSNIDQVINVIEKLAGFANTLSGYTMDLGQVGIFGSCISSIGVNLMLYSKYIDAISDFDKFRESTEVIVGLANMAETVGNTKLSNLSEFGNELVRFAETSLTDFNKVFTNANTQAIGVDFGTKLANGIRSTRVKFVLAATWVTAGFLSGIDTASRNVHDKGVDYADSFLRGIKDRADQADDIGFFVAAGVGQGITSNEKLATNAAGRLSKNLVGTMRKKLRINSPSGEGIDIGKYLDLGVAKGVADNAKGIVKNFDGVWGDMKATATRGTESIKEIVSDKGVWDFSASLGDNLTNAASAYKDFMLGDDKPDILDMFGFGDLGEQFEEQITGSTAGIVAGLENVTGEIQSGGGGGGAVGSALSNMSNALSLAVHKHFDSADYVYLGRQIGESMAIAANGAIVSKAKALGDMFDEVVQMASGGIEMWKAWSEERQAYDKLAQADLLRGWEIVQKSYNEGTKERMEADKKVYELQKALVKDTYEYSMNWIEREKELREVSYEEEIEMYERVLKRHREGTEERIALERKIAQVKEEIYQRDYQNELKRIQRETRFERMNVTEQLSAYKNLFKITKENSDERYSVEEKIFDLEKEIRQKNEENIRRAAEAEKKAREDRKKAQEDYDKNVADTEKEARDKRLKAEEDYAKNVLQVEKDLADGINNLEQKYADAVKSREQTLYKAWGLFDEVKDSDYDASVFMENLEYQVEAFESWQKELGILASRGVDESLIEELREMGPQAFEQIRELNRMTDEQLTRYQELWRRKAQLAHEQAVEELVGVRADTDAQIEALKQEAAVKLDQYRATWQSTMAQINADCSAKLAELKKQFADTMAEIQESLAELELEIPKKVQSSVSSQVSNTASGIVNGIHAGVSSTGSVMGGLIGGAIGGALSSVSNKVSSMVSNVFKKATGSASKGGRSVGSAAASGVSKGLQKKSGTVVKQSIRTASSVVKSMAKSLRVRSPSKETEYLAEMAGRGLVIGLHKMTNEVFDEGYQIGDQLRDGVSVATNHIQDIINEDMDLSPRIVPVLDIDSIEEGVSEIDGIMERSPTFRAAAYVNRELENRNTIEYNNKPNQDLLQELRMAREELSRLGDRIEGMQVRLDTGAFVGEIMDPLDQAFGFKLSRNARERG